MQVHFGDIRRAAADFLLSSRLPYLRYNTPSMKQINPPRAKQGIHCKNRAVLQARAIQVAAPGGALLLDDVTLHLHPGRLVAVAGPNGSGKSTLVRALSRVLRPKRGAALLDERDLYADLDARTAARAISVTPQETSIAFDFTAQEVVSMGRAPHQVARGVFGWETAADREAVTRAMGRAGLPPELWLRPVRSLSGGERQRVLIARTLAQEADVLILDEPTASLDLHHQTALLETLRELAHQEGRAVLVVLHDLNLAAEYADHVVLLKEGRIVAQGTPAQVVTNANVQAVYGARVWVRCHPVSSRPYLLSLPDLPVQGSGGEMAGFRVHLLCGGGSGASVMTRLMLAGARVTAGSLNKGDTDEDVARLWSVPHRRIPSFTSVPPLEDAERDALAREGAVCLLADVPFGDGNLETLRAALTLSERGMPVLAVEGGHRPFRARDFTTGGVGGELWTRLMCSSQARAVSEDDFWEALLEENVRLRVGLSLPGIFSDSPGDSMQEIQNACANPNCVPAGERA